MVVCSGRYELKHEENVGYGSFGSVCKGWDTHQNRDVAIKIEDVAERQKSSVSAEQAAYKALGTTGGKTAKGFATLYAWRKENRQQVLVMELLGANLENLLQKYRDSHHSKDGFSLKSVLMIGIQLIDRLQYIHRFGLLHQDIKVSI